MKTEHGVLLEPRTEKIRSIPGVQEELVQLHESHRFVKRFRGDLAKMVVVMTFGSYQILHTEHARYLASAKALGDVLILMLDSTEYLQQRKGKERDFISFEERANLLAWFPFVHFIISHNGDNMHAIESLQPDIIVASASTNNKGDTVKDRAEEIKYQEERGRQFVVFPADNQSGISTSGIIRKIVNNYTK